MEKKINIAELLKDFPSGMELNCTTWENVTFEEVVNDKIYVKRNNKVPSFDKIVVLNNYGCCTNHQDEKCRIFPKGMNTWEGFVPPCKFKDGDIVATTNGRYIGITTGGNSESSMPTYCVIKMSGEFEAYFGRKEKWMFSRFASEEEKQKLFQAIKDRGYKWNAETKTLDKLIIPKFKVGDMVKSKYNTNQYVIKGITATHYTLEEVKEKFKYTEPIIEDKNWELVSNKFDINTLKPFDKVLVRLSNDSVWVPKFFSNYSTNPKMKRYPFVTTDSVGYPQCIPYNGNEHLCITTRDCDKYYKIWE